MSIGFFLPVNVTNHVASTRSTGPGNRIARLQWIGYFEGMAEGREKPRVTVGVTGGIACYKAVELVRLLAKEAYTVQVIMSRGAMSFVAPLTFQTLSGRAVASDTFSLTEESQIGHINLADQSDLFVIAPATANIIGKLANGIADDLMTTVLMATQAPVLVVPAMNVHMYAHPALQENLAKLGRLGYHVMDPTEGSLACGYEGKGRLPEPESIFEEIQRLLRPQDLVGERIVITAGPTREAIDPVRYVSNRSSGKMGYALARAAVQRGAEVVLISGPTSLQPPPGLRWVSVTTAAEMREAVHREAKKCTAVIMAAAVADYRPVDVPCHKMKRGDGILELRMEPNPDILRELGTEKSGKLLIGFAAETENLTANAQKKLQAKNLDMIVANNVAQQGSGFDVDTNIATLVTRGGACQTLPLMSKAALADRILDQFASLKSDS